MPRGLPVFVLLALTALGCGHKGEAPSAPTAPTTPISTAPTPTPPSDPSPPTPPQPGCTYAVTADPDDFERDGGNGVLKIATAAGCRWTAKADGTWVVIEGVAQGEGPAALKFSVQPNDEAPARKMTVAVQDASASIAQPGQGDCAFQVSPLFALVPRMAWSGEVAITTSRGCLWTTSSDVPWLRVARTSGRGSATVAYDADFNPEVRYAEKRTATLAFRWLAPTAGENARVYQSGNCNLVFTPATGGLATGASFSGDTTGGALTATAAGGVFHFWVLTDPYTGCAWTAESGDNWLTFDFPKRHQIMGGDADLHFTLPANDSPQARRAAIVMDGKPLTILQQGR